MHPDEILATARAVVTDPETFHNRPSVMQDAWAALKQARGQTVDFTQLYGREQHIVVAKATRGEVIALTGFDPDHDLDLQSQRVIARVRAQCAGVDDHPFGGDAA